MYDVASLLESIEESLSSGADDEDPRRALEDEVELDPVGGPAGDEGSDDEPGPLIDDDEASDWSESDSEDGGEVDEEASEGLVDAGPSNAGPSNAGPSNAGPSNTNSNLPLAL
ncbi:hypothetical protein VOLCADRAFT_101279, partial [Volvox carteri f. nagariensis]